MLKRKPLRFIPGLVGVIVYLVGNVTEIRCELDVLDGGVRCEAFVASQ